MARCDGAGVRLITRHGNDFAARFPLAAEAVRALPANLFLLDGEAIVTNARGLAPFDLIRHKRHGGDVVLIAFDLIELDGEDCAVRPLSPPSASRQSPVAADKMRLNLTTSSAPRLGTARLQFSLSAFARCCPPELRWPIRHTAGSDASSRPYPRIASGGMTESRGAGYCAESCGDLGGNT